MTTTEPSAPCLSSLLGRRLLGTTVAQQEGVRRLGHLALAQMGYLAVLGLAGYAELVPFKQIGYMLAYCLAGWLALYVLLRSGWYARHADLSLDTAMMLFRVSAIVVAFGVIDMARSLALQLVCLALVSHIDRLRLRQAVLITIGSAVALLAALAALWWLTPERIDLCVEVNNLALVIVLLPVAVFLINEANRVASHATRHSGALSTTLSRLRQEARRDETTGLPNQRHMTELMQSEVLRQSRNGQMFCLTFFDADFAGTAPSPDMRRRVLRTVATLADKVISPADTLAYWSADRFALMQPAMHLPEAQVAVERIRQAVREYPWSRIEKSLSVRLSAGSAAHPFSEPLNTTLEHVEQALRHARERGPDHSATAADRPAPQAVEISRRNHAQTQSVPTRQPVRPVMRVAPAPGAPAANAVVPPMSALLSRALRSVRDLLLSTTPVVRQHVRLSLAGALVYAVWIAYLRLYALPHGLIAPGFAHWLVAYDLIGMLAFYPLIRGGWTARWRPGQTILVQMLYGCGACAVCYAATPDLRAECLQFMCFIQLFGMAALTARQTRVVAIAAIAMQCGALAWSWVTHANEPSFAIEVLTLGMSSFIVARISQRSFRFAAFRQRVEQEQGALSDAVEQLRGQLIHDPLTGLLTREQLIEHIERDTARHRRSGRGFCVALIGFDQFERRTGRYSYAVNDALLARIGPLASAELRQTDTIGRWTPQTFLVLLPDTATGAQATRGLDRLRQRLTEQLPPESAAHSRLTLSCGVAEFRVDETWLRLIERAERGLYAARASGGNRCVLAD